MGGWAEMGGIRKSAPFLHLRVFFAGRRMGGTGGMMIPGIVSACPFARGMLSHACKALRTPFPLSQSG